jgi:biotin carboxylase
VPALTRARELGFRVGALDRDPVAAGRDLADDFFLVSTTDVLGVTRVAQEYRPRGIVTIGTDMAMRAIAVACARLGLTGPSEAAIQQATDKGAMAEAFASHSVLAPRFRVIQKEDGVDGLREDLGWPYVLKPVDSSGSRGVVLVDELADPAECLAYALAQSRSGRVIAQEYVVGPECSVEMLCFGGRSHVVAVTDKLTSGAPHFVELGHSQPTGLDSARSREVGEVAVKAVGALGLQDCAAHVECVLTDEGPKVIELGARLGGDLITSHLTPLSTGVDMIEGLIRIACGEEPRLEPQPVRGSAVRFFQGPDSGRFAVTGIEDARRRPGVMEVTVLANLGRPFQSSVDRAGYVLAVADDAAGAIQICEESLAGLLIVPESGVP